MLLLNKEKLSIKICCCQEAKENIITLYKSYETLVEHRRLFRTYELDQYPKAPNDHRMYHRNLSFIEQNSYLLESTNTKDNESSGLPKQITNTLIKTILPFHIMITEKKCCQQKH